MTNLTSEQYRDVLKNVPKSTEKIPTVQQLLRRAVDTFFRRFGAYPEFGGVAPGKIGIFGDQIQFDGGIALPAASPLMTVVVGRRAPGNKFTVVTSADVGKPHKVKFSFSRNRPLGPGCPTWLNHVKGVIDNYKEDEVPPFEAAIESSIPMSVGFGSGSAIEVAVYSFIEVLVGKKSDPIQKAIACQRAEEFAGKKVGLVDRITSILAKDRNVLVVDCQTNEVEYVPFKNPDVAFVAIDSHVKDTLFGDEYPERSKHLKKACEMLGVQSLRECTEEDLLKLEEKVNDLLAQREMEEEEREQLMEDEEEGEGESEEGAGGETGNIWTKEEYETMIKRARFFVTEVQRVKDVVEAWKEGDMKTFGEKMNESHLALKKDFDFGNPLLDFLVDTSLEVEGVMGSRMTGMGLGYGGAIISVMNKKNVEKYCEYVTQKLAEFEKQIATEMKEARIKEKERRYEIKRKAHFENFDPTIASSERIEKLRRRLEYGGSATILTKKTSSVGGSFCSLKKSIPCILTVEKEDGQCRTWARYQKDKDKKEFYRRMLVEEEEEEMKKIEKKRKKERKMKKEKESMEENEDENNKYKNEKNKKEKKRERKNNKIEENMAAKRRNRSTSFTYDSVSSEATDVRIKGPSFYLLSPFAGARMLFVTKEDILRSLYAEYVPQPKALAKTALEEFQATYGGKPEAVGLAPASVILFGEFLEFHMGYIICMALAMYTVTAGGRNDTVFYSLKTLSEYVQPPTQMKEPLPSVRVKESDSRKWVNYVQGAIGDFRGHVPGFNAVINSSVPEEIGVNSCAALQASLITFLENLTRECTVDPFEKANRYSKNEYEFSSSTELITKCSVIKFFPTFMCKEGHLMLIDCKRYKISHYFFDHPSYVFLICRVKENTSNVTLESLHQKQKDCIEAAEILERSSLLNADLRHLRCLEKRDAREEVIKRAKYVITEHQRTVEAVKAMRDEDYARVGVLMNESHASLRDDYDVSSPEMENLIRLATSVDGVLGAKMLGPGLNSTIIILARITNADDCIRYVKKNYRPKRDKPIFYITKPSRGAYMMNPNVDVLSIP